MAKIRKRLWLGDIYKALIENAVPIVRDIDILLVSKFTIRALIRDVWYEFSAIDEECRRKAVKAINKIISEVNKNVPQ